MNELRREMLTKEEINYMQNTDTLTLDISTLNVKKTLYSELCVEFNNILIYTTIYSLGNMNFKLYILINRFNTSLLIE